MVGSDSSSATHGSSTFKVAGRKRAPTKQCADALEEKSDSKESARVAGAAWRRKVRLTAVLHCRPEGAREAPDRKTIVQAVNGGARLSPARERKLNAG